MPGARQGKRKERMAIEAYPRDFLRRLLRMSHSPSHHEHASDYRKPQPFWILDCRFSIVGSKPKDCRSRCLRHILGFQSKIQNRKSKIHLITLFALASTFGGIIRPRDFAVWRLIASWIFSIVSTRRSPGWEPLRTRWTYLADARPTS
jgi:hypothetical protein